MVLLRKVNVPLNVQNANKPHKAALIVYHP